jgi:hypothetical protein
MLYATIGDTVEEFKNKKGEIEARTVEGEIVMKDIEVWLSPYDFKYKYDHIQNNYPGAIVRFQRDPK